MKLEVSAEIPYPRALVFEIYRDKLPELESSGAPPMASQTDARISHGKLFEIIWPK